MTHSNCRSYVITASKHRDYVYTWDHFVFWLLRGPVTVTVVLSLPPDLKQICRNGQVALRENWSKFDNICLRSCYLFTEIKCTRAGMGYSMWLYICLIETVFLPKEHGHGTRCVAGPCDVCNGWLHPSGNFLDKELVFFMKAGPHDWCEVSQ